MCGNEDGNVDERVLCCVVELDGIVDGRCLVWCEEGMEGGGIRILGVVDHDCEIREADRESVFKPSVDANNEIQGVSMWMESGCAVWTYTTYGRVCLKK